MTHRRNAAALMALTLALSACGGASSGLNPLRWFGGGQRGPATLEPPGGYVSHDRRELIGRITGAHWEPLGEGRLLVVTALAPTKGWWDAALTTENPAPTGKLTPDADGVLRLRFVAAPPAPDMPEARIAARPEVDTITAALSVSTVALAGIERVVIQSAGNVVTLAR